MISKFSKPSEHETRKEIEFGDALLRLFHLSTTKDKVRKARSPTGMDKKVGLHLCQFIHS